MFFQRKMLKSRKAGREKHMAKKLEVRITGRLEPIIVEVRDTETPESWLQNCGYPSGHGILVVLDGTSYPKDDIVSVCEHGIRRRLTNMSAN